MVSSRRGVVTIQGRQQYLWRAVDEDGDVLDILVQPRRNRHAAVGRHLLRSAHHRLLRTRAFVEWDAVTCAY